MPDPSPTDRAVAQRDALLLLSQRLAAPRSSGALAEALDLVLGGLGCARGAAYQRVAGELVLAAHRALSPELHEKIGRLPLDGGWFIAQQALKARSPVVEANLAGNARLDPALCHESGWVSLAAAPILFGREMLGVLVAAHRTREVFDGGSLAFLETAANFVAPVLLRESEAAGRSTMGALPPGAHLLWIDDDALFLRSIRRAIKGFDVLTARTAAEAEELFESGILPHRIFCDAGLPDRGGHELHAAIKVEHPELADRFVFVTGGAITADVADYLVASRCPTMLKPVRIEDVEALLKGPGSSAPPGAAASGPPGNDGGSIPIPSARSSRGRRKKGG